MQQFCQSCGFPLAKDKQGGGSEKDGRKSQLYCSMCYVNGKFVVEFATAKEMQDFCVNEMHKAGMPRWWAWLLTRPIPRLSRWRK